MLNADAGTGRTIGWTAPGRADVVARRQSSGAGAARRPRAPASSTRASDTRFSPTARPSSSRAFRSLDLNADDTRYEDIHHKAADTIERVDARNLAIGAAAVAATAYAIADAAVPVAPRLDRRCDRAATAQERMTGKLAG